MMTTTYKNTCQQCEYTTESTSKPLVHSGMDEIARTVGLRKTYAYRYEKWIKDKHHFDCIVESYRKTAKEANMKYSSVGIVHTVETCVGYAGLLCNGGVITSHTMSVSEPMKTTLEHEYIECEICGHCQIVTTKTVRVDKEE